MEAWLLARWAEFDAGDRAAGDAIDRVVRAEAPRYPDTETTFDYGATYEMRLCFRLVHEFGFGVACVYCPVPPDRVDIHEVADLTRRLALFGVRGYAPPTPEAMKMDFAAFLRRPAPEGATP